MVGAVDRACDANCCSELEDLEFEGVEHWNVLQLLHASQCVKNIHT